MPCYRPIEIQIQRQRAAGREFLKGDTQVVPCGSCIGCRGEQSRQWAVRMMHESRMHENNSFLTLTIDDEHLNENSEVSARDFSRFIRDLRKTQERRISFFGCGEYGETTGRPHYHTLVFGGTGFLDRDIGFDSSRPHVWRSKALDAVWGRGLCEGGSVTMASASYVSGYIRKKLKKRDECRVTPYGELKTQEFARMSLRPAIGKRWIERWWNDVYGNGRDMIVVDGVEAKPPRFYDRWMDYTDQQGGTEQRRVMMEEVRQQRYLDTVVPTDYQLTAGEKIHQSRVNLFQRRAAV